MAIIDLNSKILRIGFWGKMRVVQPQSAGDSLAISDSIVVKVIVKLAESVGITDISPVRRSIQDLIVLVEGISAWVKGAIKTLFISDDRYFRKRG